MTTPTPLPPESFAGAVSGCWKLSEGHALTLRPTHSGVLRIAHGRVWITFEHTQRDDGARGGDHFLGAGDVLPLLPGQGLVMESWNAAAHSATYFSWDRLPATVGVPITSRRPLVFAGNPQWRSGVVQPLRDLRVAFGLAGAASARLLAGLADALAVGRLGGIARFAIDFVAGRARGDLAERAFKAQSSDSRAHGAIR